MVRQQDQLMTTGDVARWCHVTTNAVKKWIRDKNLAAFKTPGGHFRIRTIDFEDFLTRYRMPMIDELRDRRTPKILVVDDDPAVRDMWIAALSDKTLGLAVAGASDGFEALILIGHLKPDVVILDIKMPRIDGLEVCRKIKANPNNKKIAIVVATGYPTRQNVKKAKELGVDAILTKPIGIDELTGTVLKVLETTRAEARMHAR